MAHQYQYHERPSVKGKRKFKGLHEQMELQTTAAKHFKMTAGQVTGKKEVVVAEKQLNKILLADLNDKEFSDLAESKRNTIVIDGTEFSVIVMSSPFNESLRPSSMYTLNCQNLTNIWEFSRVYKRVPKISISVKSSSIPIQIWSHEEKELYDSKNKVILQDYWVWRLKGVTRNNAVFNPAGFDEANNPNLIVGYVPTGLKLTDVKEARKYYTKVYYQIAAGKTQFLAINKTFQTKNILILDKMSVRNRPSLHLKDEKINAWKVDKHLIESVLSETETHNRVNTGLCLAMALLTKNKT